MKNFLNIQSKLDYSFKDIELLKAALRHSSLIKKDSRTFGSERSFDRLEFLGDRVLNLLVAELLYRHFIFESEGDLAHRYTALVCYETCAEVAKDISLDYFLEVAVGTTFDDLRILGDALEAILGAIYLDGGFQPCRRFVELHWKERVLKPSVPPQDPKSTLQEFAQSQGKDLPEYSVVDKSGSEHNPIYTVSVFVEGYPLVKGIGHSKKIAEKNAAENLLQIIT